MGELKDKLAEFLPHRPAKPTNAQILFPELQRELNAEPGLAKNLQGLFIVTVLQKGVKGDEWYLLFKGLGSPPVISQTRPTLPPPSASSKKHAGGFPLPVVLIEIEDHDILNFITGGLPALKAYTSQRVKIIGDLLLAQQLEDVFAKAGGAEKVAGFLKNAKAKGGKTSKL
ncbi:hypothetical protein HKX48_007792 [Thoreauomyces humboldtii]|nr:hypothetical protein HKX48_007792 [Thoreauomyces humboldtii]